MHKQNNVPHQQPPGLLYERHKFGYDYFSRDYAPFVQLDLCISFIGYITVHSDLAPADCATPRWERFVAPVVVDTSPLTFYTKKSASPAA
jgi:hypothetical protein